MCENDFVLKGVKLKTTTTKKKKKVGVDEFPPLGSGPP